MIVKHLVYQKIKNYLYTKPFVCCMRAYSVAFESLSLFHQVKPFDKKNLNIKKKKSS